MMPKKKKIEAPDLWCWKRIEGISKDGEKTNKEVLEPWEKDV